MSFGFSAGDFLLLIQLAKTTYKNCVEAGTEYNEIAREIRSLYSILKPLRDEAENADSSLFRQDQGSAAELVKAIDGCNHILEDLQILLVRHEGLSTTGEAVSAPKKLWHRFRFSSKIEQLGAVRGKLIAYTSTISVLLDGVHLRATGRVEEKVDNISSQMTEGFASLKNAILGMAVKARIDKRGGSTMSLLSLSTYAEDDKEIWQEFRRELVSLGFRSKALDRHKDLLQAYMLKLDQSGLLDEVKSVQDLNTVRPWWEKQAFLETVNSLPGLQPIEEEVRASQLTYPGEGNASVTPSQNFNISDRNEETLPPEGPPGGKLLPQDSGISPRIGLRPPEETAASVSKEKSPAMSSNVALADLLLPTDSDESEKETTGVKRTRRVRSKKKPGKRASDTDSGGISADLLPRRVRNKPKPESKAVTESNPEAIEGLLNDKDEHGNNINADRLPSKLVDITNPQTLYMSQSDETLLDGNASIVTFSQEPFGPEQDGGPSQVHHNLGKRPENIVLDDGVPNIHQAETSNAGGVRNAAQDSQRPASQRENVLTDLQDKRAIDTFLPHLENKQSEKLNRTHSRIQDTPYRTPSLAHTQFPSRKAISGAMPVTSSPSQIEPRPRAETGSQSHGQSKRLTSKGSSISGLSKVTIGLAGISTMLGLQLSGRDAKRRRGYIPDSSYIIHSDTDRSPTIFSDSDRSNTVYSESVYYDNTTDSEDDGNSSRNIRRKAKSVSVDRLPRTSGRTHEISETNFRKPNERTRGAASRPAHDSSTALIDSAILANVDGSQDGQKTQNDPPSRKPENAYVESASESDPEIPITNSLTRKGSSLAVGSDPPVEYNEPRKENELKKAIGVDTKLDQEAGSEPRETLRSTHTLRKSREPDLSSTEEEKLRRENEMHGHPQEWNNLRLVVGTPEYVINDFFKARKVKLVEGGLSPVACLDGFIVHPDGSPFDTRQRIVKDSGGEALVDVLEPLSGLILEIILRMWPADEQERARMMAARRIANREQLDFTYAELSTDKFLPILLDLDIESYNRVTTGDAPYVILSMKELDREARKSQARPARSSAAEKGQQPKRVTVTPGGRKITMRKLTKEEVSAERARRKRISRGDGDFSPIAEEKRRSGEATARRREDEVSSLPKSHRRKTEQEVPSMRKNPSVSHYARERRSKEARTDDTLGKIVSWLSRDGFNSDDESRRRRGNRAYM